MGNMALVVCGVKKTEEAPKGGFFKRFKYSIKKLLAIIKEYFVKPDLRPAVGKVDISEALRLYTIELPFDIDKLKKSGKNVLSEIDKQLCEIKAQNNISYCIAPEPICGIYPFEAFSKLRFSGRYLYKALACCMLEEIYNKKGINYSDLDMAIINGSKDAELTSMVRLLSNRLKYITVLTANKETISKEMDEVYEDTGLAVYVTDDFKHGVRHADIIINLEDKESISAYLKVKPKAVIINYCKEGIPQIGSENININGIVVKLPDRIIRYIDKNVFNYFSALEIAEMIIAHKLDCVNRMLIVNAYVNASTEEWETEVDGNRIDDYILYESISKEFRREGYLIKAFVGRHGIIKA